MMQIGFIEKAKNWIFISLLLVITLIAFLPSLSAYFVAWDDNVYLIKNKTLSTFGQEWSWTYVKNMFITNVGGNYDPLPVLTYAIEKYFFAPDPLTSTFIFHLDNLLLHMGSTIAVFFLFRKLRVSKVAAFWGALLFGIHPMRVESVAWITERKDVLYGLFFILSLLAYINYISSRQRKWYIWALVLSLFTYFSKVQAVTLPLSMVVLDVFYKRKWYSARVLIVEKLPWWVLSLVFGIATLYFLNKYNILNGPDPFTHFNIFNKVALGALSYITYLAKFVYPYQMLPLYEYPITMPILAYVCLALFIGILIVMWFVRKNSTIVFGWAFFTVNIVLMLQVLSAGTGYLSDRFTYIAYIGLIFLVIKGYEWCITHFDRYKYLLSGVFGSYLVLMIFTTYGQVKVWRNSVALWSHCIDSYPDKYFGYFMRGSYYEQVVMNKWPDPYITEDYGTCLQNALSDLSTAIAINAMNVNPDVKNSVDLFIDHGVVCGMLQKYDSSINDFTKAILLTPDRKECYSNRAFTYAFEKKYAEAIKDYKQFMRMDSTNDGVYYRCAVCEGNVGDLQAGLFDLSKAVALNGTDPNYYLARADFYRALHRFEPMHLDAHKAQAMGANVPPILLQ